MCLSRDLMTKVHHQLLKRPVHGNSLHLKKWTSVNTISKTGRCSIETFGGYPTPYLARFPNILTDPQFATILAGAGNFSLRHRVQNGSGASSVPYEMGTEGKASGA